MALIATRWEYANFFPSPDQSDWTEGTGGMSVTTGWYENPARPNEPILVYSAKAVLNQHGHEISSVVEEWSYDVPGGPPQEFVKEEWSRAYLPGIGGRRFRLVQKERVIFWTFSPLTSAHNLGRTKIISGYVVYDLPRDPTKATSSEAAAKTEDAGMTPGPVQDRIVQSGKLWSSANLGNSVVPKVDAGQEAKWVDNVIEEQDLVEEEWDKWIVWTMKKDMLRSAGVTWDGPRYIKKDNIRYRLPVPVQPPTIKVQNRVGGLNIEIKGGGAKIINPYYGPNGTIEMRPQLYHVFRAKNFEPDRTSSGNIGGFYETSPGPVSVRRVIGDTAVTMLDGSPTTPPNSSLPAAESYTETHDAEPEPEEPDTSFRLIATVENENGDNTEGFGEWFDTDVEDTGKYEYYATAIIEDDESTDSNHESATFSGTGTRSYRLTVRSDDDGTSVDAVAPDDPALPPPDFGELFEFEIPTADDPFAVGTKIADRQFAARRQQDFSIRLEVLMPLLGVEYGQLVTLPALAWEAFGNSLHLSTEVESVDWSLVGFSLRVERSADGRWRSPTTNLTLQQFPRI